MGEWVWVPMWLFCVVEWVNSVCGCVDDPHPAPPPTHTRTLRNRYDPDYRGESPLLSLNLRNSGLRQSDMLTIAEVLEHNQSLTTLNLRDNYVGPSGGVGLIRGTPKNLLHNMLIFSVQYLCYHWYSS